MKRVFLLSVAATVMIPLFSQNETAIFTRVEEPREKALSFLVPKGWVTEGGAIRILDPAIAGANNMVDCKFDLAVKKDSEGSVMIRWLPEMLCIDQGQAWGNPEGAVFNNTLVRRKRDPVSFIMQVAVPYAHPAAQNTSLKGSKQLPALASAYASAVDPSVKMFMNPVYTAAIAEYSYVENGRRYSERMVTVIEDLGRNAGGLWKNRGTILIRTPEGELEQWEPVFSVIQNSGIWSIKWVEGEINGQRQRAGQIALTQKELQEIDNAMAESRRNTNSEINKDIYHTLTGQEEFTNPFTGKPETDSNNWQKRWVNASGDIIFTNNPTYDPNRDPSLQVQGFKLSVPRK
jgi:hypothetical protein